MAPNLCCFCFENSSQLPLSIVAHSNLTSPPLEEPLEMTSCEMVFFFFLKQGARRLSHEMEKVECFISFFYSDTDVPLCSSSLHGLSGSTATGSTPLESKQFIDLHPDPLSGQSEQNSNGIYLFSSTSLHSLETAEFLRVSHPVNCRLPPDVVTSEQDHAQPAGPVPQVSAGAAET